MIAHIIFILALYSLKPFNTKLNESLTMLLVELIPPSYWLIYRLNSTHTGSIQDPDQFMVSDTGAKLPFHSSSILAPYELITPSSDEL